MSSRVRRAMGWLVGVIVTIASVAALVTLVGLCRFREMERASADYIEQVLTYDWVGDSRRVQLLRDLEITRASVKDMDDNLGVCDVIVPFLPQADPHWWQIGGMRRGPPATKPASAGPPTGTGAPKSASPGP